MFGISGMEFLVIAAFILIIFGPDKLPEIGRTLGMFLRQFNRAREDMERIVRAEMYAADPEKKNSLYAPQAPEWYVSLTRGSTTESTDEGAETTADDAGGEPGATEAEAEELEAVPSSAGTATETAKEPVFVGPVADEMDDDEEEDEE